MFVASPEVAEPPRVLSDTRASPDELVWVLSLVILIVLLLLTVEELVELKVTRFIESGPVLRLVPVLFVFADVVVALELRVLFTVAVTLSVLELSAWPLVASPALVLCRVTASPL